MTDNHGYVLSPLPVAPVNEMDMVLLPKGLKALKKVAKKVGLDLKGAYINLDAGFDSTHNRKCIFTAGMIPGSVPITGTRALGVITTGVEGARESSTTRPSSRHDRSVWQPWPG
jgi:hypothetical protein